MIKGRGADRGRTGAPSHSYAPTNTVSIPDLRKFKEAEQLLYDSQFQDHDVVPALPAKL